MVLYLLTRLARERSCERNRALVAGIKSGVCELNGARRTYGWLVKFLGLLLVCYMPLAIVASRGRIARGSRIA